jgi:hypothetical protein
MDTHTYPDAWPKPNPKKPLSLVTRITEQQKRNLYNRLVTTRELAKNLEVHEAYLSAIFPGKVKPVAQQIKEGMHKKRAIRLVFRRLLARQVLKGEISLNAATARANVSERTMRRILKQVQSETRTES